MPDIQFFQTPMGRQYYERTLPELVKAINTLAIELRESNALKRKEMDFHTEPVEGPH